MSTLHRAQLLLESEQHQALAEIAKLAGARCTKNAELAAETAAGLADMIRRYRAKVWNTGGVLPWDWYAIAVETWQSLALPLHPLTVRL